MQAHRKETIKATAKHFASQAKRAKIIHPCGAGKSLTGYWIAQNLKVNKVIAAVPSLTLVRQLLRTWTREALANKVDIEWLCVCSDKTVSNATEEDALALQELGVDVTTDATDIGKWLRKRTKGIKVVFTTYQSGKTLSKASKGVSFDLGIFDEAHKTVGRADKPFSHLLFDQNIKIKRRVFMTATERHYRGSSDDIISMDDPEVYGETIDHLSFAAAIESDLLCDYKVHSICVLRSEVEQWIRDNRWVRPEGWEEDTEAEHLAGAIALRKAMQKFPINHALSFHSSIRRSKDFRSTVEKLNDSFGDLDTFHVSSKLSTAERDRILHGEFAKSRKALVTNSRCLTEGVDIALIDCVNFADPKRSTVDIVQATGRAMRVAKGKTLGHVVIPVLLDDCSSGEEFEQSAFEKIIIVVSALATNDERIVDEFKSIQGGKRRTNRICDFDMSVIDSLDIDINQLIGNIQLRTWSRVSGLSRTIEGVRKQIQEWFDEHGKCPTPMTNSFWSNHNDWLRKGRGTSLNILCIEMGLKWDPRSRTIGGIKKEIQNWFDERGECPTSKTNKWWRNHDAWLRKRGTSVSQLYIDIGLKEAIPDRTITGIKKEIQDWFDEHGKCPTLITDSFWSNHNDWLRNRHATSLRDLCIEMGLKWDPRSRTIGGIKKEIQDWFDGRGECPTNKTNKRWRNHDAWLSRQDTSLSQLCIDIGLKEAISDRTITGIKKEIREWFDEHGKCPAQTTNSFWENHDVWLRKRGTPLSQLCIDMGLREDLANRTIKGIRKEIQDWFDGRGECPSSTTNARWNKQNQWLGRQGTSLSKLCTDIGLKEAIPDRTIKSIKKEIQDWFDEQGKLPTKATNSFWSNHNNWLRNRHGTSLSKLKNELESEGKLKTGRT